MPEKISVSSVRTNNHREVSLSGIQATDVAVGRKELYMALMANGVEANFQDENENLKVIYKFHFSDKNRTSGTLDIHSQKDQSLIGYIFYRAANGVARIVVKKFLKDNKEFHGKGIMTTGESLLAEVFKQKNIFTISGEILSGNSPSLESRFHMRSIFEPTRYYSSGAMPKGGSTETLIVTTFLNTTLEEPVKYQQ